MPSRAPKPTFPVSCTFGCESGLVRSGLVSVWLGLVCTPIGEFGVGFWPVFDPESEISAPRGGYSGIPPRRMGDLGVRAPQK
jgi:hypothetical protein